MERPNILYIHSHDTGRYVQPYGYPVPTPNIQHLAEEGVMFRQAFCCGPTCSPSRAALLTGQSPHNAGMTGLAHRGWRLNDYSQHIVHTLRPAGYRTALVGVQHVAADASVIGYDETWTKGMWAADVAPAAAQWLSKPSDRPFFLSVGMEETHRGFPEPGEHDDPRYVRPPAHLPDTPEARADFAAFRTSARRLDAGIGQVLTALTDRGLADNTLVICTTDHGIPFPGCKCTLTDRGMGVMLIIRGPGGFGGGKVIDSMVSHIDIFPTVCDLLGIERPGHLQGESVLPLVRGEAEQIHEEVYGEVSYHAAYEPQRAVRTSRYKYIRRYAERQQPFLANTDEGSCLDTWIAGGWADKALDREELYDLVLDPWECKSIAADPGLADVLADMRQRLDAWMQRTDDPLLAGPVPAPEGALISEPDDVSANDVRRRLGLV